MLLNTKKRNILGLAVALAVVAACTPDKPAVDAETADSLATAYVELHDTLQSVWSAYEAAESENLVDIKRLVEEVSYTEEFDSGEFVALMDMHSQLVEMKQDRMALTPATVQAYDSLSHELQLRAVAFATEHPAYQNYPTMGKLVASLTERDYERLRLKADYSELAELNNEFVQEYRAIADTSGVDTVLVRPLPTFWVE